MSLTDAFAEQARACAALGSPFMERLLTFLSENWPETSALGKVCAAWEGDLGPSGASLPLRIAGGLHALVLTGTSQELRSVYPPAEADPHRLGASVLAALATHEDFMLDWIRNAPQTNEVRRSAVIIPTAHLLARRFGLPFLVSELGASAGLNLTWDRYALATNKGTLGPGDPALTLTPEWAGPLPDPRPVSVVDRRGVDLNPLDIHDTDQALRLKSYLWPDQPHRMELTEAAMRAQDAKVDQGDAIDWLQTRLRDQKQSHLHLIYHTIAWQYFPAETQARGQNMIEAAGLRATEDSPLAWLSFEADGGKDGAAIVLRLWPGDLTVPLGRADFHGRWVKWTDMQQLP